MHILASPARSLLNFNWNIISPILKIWTRTFILITCIYEHMQFNEKYIAEIGILVFTFETELI